MNVKWLRAPIFKDTTSLKTRPSGEGFCLFHAADTRGRVELETMLGTEFAGVLSSDDFSVYNGGNIAAQQKCLAHLRRHFKKVLELPGNNNAAVAKRISVINR